MKNKTNREYSQTQINQILSQYEKHVPLKKIAEESGRPTGGIYFLTFHYKLFKQNPNDSRLSDGERKRFTAFLKSATTNSAGGGLVSESAMPDHFQKLKDANTHYEQTIQEFIEAEIARRVSAVQKENAELKEKVKKLNEEVIHYQEAFAEAKNSNWVDKLRDKWGSTQGR